MERTIRPEDLATVLVTDCGSTTTKALLFQLTSAGWRMTSRGEAPTTVEDPVADVTVGALNAFSEVEELSKRKILRPGVLSSTEPPFLEKTGRKDEGIDLYLSTSSAGGGLQMLVTGVVPTMSAESAERAALGAGAIVMERIAADDEREEHELILRIRHLKPDIVLLAGGVNGGSRTHAVEMAEMLVAAAPRPRFGDTLQLPVIYAGNEQVSGEVRRILEKIAQVSVVSNVRPTLEAEDLDPARAAIHEFFLTHVMSHSPGYGKLLRWTPCPVMPTPAAVGDMVEHFATKNHLQVLCVDIGGATTDVFSVFRDATGKEHFHRTVSANLGMSYSIANVLVESGVAQISRWLPYRLEEHQLRDRLRNKMIRPTTIPQTVEDLWLEQAVAREALRLSLMHHRSLAVGLSGIQQQRGISDIFSQSTNRAELVDMMAVDLVIGSGGVLSHAPSRLGAAFMMLDAFELEGLTEIAVDSVFMLPHLGVFASVHPKAAEEIFLHDCLVRICHSIAPVFPRRRKRRGVVASVLIDRKQRVEIHDGVISHLPLEPGSEVELLVTPELHGVDVGNGVGRTLERVIKVGLEGLLLDGRNRPLQWEDDADRRVASRREAFLALGLMKKPDAFGLFYQQ